VLVADLLCFLRSGRMHGDGQEGGNENG